MDALRRAFHDISVGYTRERLFGRTVYVKHLSYGDQIENDAKRDEFYTEAKSQGLPTAEQKLAMLIKEGAWSDVEEKALIASKKQLAELIEGKQKVLRMPSLVAKYSEQIKTEEEVYAKRYIAKQQLLGLTCESYADRQLNDHYIYTNLYSDKALTTPFFEDSEFDYLSEDDMGTTTKAYNRAVESCSETAIKKLAIQPFFQNYFGLIGDNLGQFFGKPICSLTFFQVRVLSLGAHFRSVFTSHDTSKFPANVREDPDLLTDYAMAATKGKEEMQKQGAYDEGTIVMGAKTEDAGILGVKTKPNLASEIMAQGGGSVIEWMRKRG